MTPKRTRPALLALLSAALSNSCAGSNGDESSPPRLAGRDFVSQSVTGFELVQGTRIRLSFTDREIDAYAGCNHLSSTYRIEGEVLKFAGEYGSTAIGCSPELQAQDDFVSNFFRSNPSFVLEEPELTLMTDSVTITLLDSEVAIPDRPLVGTQWVGNGIGDTSVVWSGPGGELATILFTEDDLVDVMTPCQHGSGAFAADATTITFSDLSYDGASCANTSYVMVSDAVMGVLDGSPVSYEIDETSLTLTRGDNFLMYVASE